MPVRKSTSLFPKHFHASINISSCPKNYIFFIFAITLCASSVHILSTYLFPPLSSFPSRSPHSSVLVTFFRPTQYFIALHQSGSLYIVDHPRLNILLALYLCLHIGSLPSLLSMFPNSQIIYTQYIYIFAVATAFFAPITTYPLHHHFATLTFLFPDDTLSSFVDILHISAISIHSSGSTSTMTPTLFSTNAFLLA